MRARSAPILRILLGALLAGTVVITAASPAFASDRTDARARIGSGIGTVLRPGDRVAENGITLRVPGPGQSIWAAAEYQDGTVQEFRIVTDRSGAVVVLDGGDDAIAPDPQPNAVETFSQAAATRRSGECSVQARRLYKWRTPVYRWHYSARTTPRKFDSRPGGRRQVIDAIIRANRAITREENKCGRGDRVSARFEYLGVTRKRPLGSGASCGRRDRVSTIGWGYLPNRAIAFMCVLSQRNGRTVEADVKLSSTQPYETTMTRCHNEFLIEAAMTHEFGHVYGLGHVGSRSLTMHPHVAWCSRAQRTLGIGDMLGLERKY